MRVIFVDHQGVKYVVEGKQDEKVMRCAANHLVPGILGECGGSIACGTCHGYVADEWYDRLPPPSSQEEYLLAECIDRKFNSRLTCQIILTEDLEGLTILVPKNQT
jgi:ferredoxin, 2Fe-2S